MNHHHRISFTELGHLLTRSGLTYPEVSSKVYHDSCCQLGSSISLPSVIYFEAFYLHVVSSFSCIPVICPKLLLFLTPLQFVHLFCNGIKEVYITHGRHAKCLQNFSQKIRRHETTNQISAHVCISKCKKVKLVSVHDMKTCSCS